jgi:hypothetical protein
MQNPRLNASIGLALSMGCLMFVLVIGALFLGLYIDQTFFPGNRRLVTLFCVIGSVPITLAVALGLTRLLLSRIIPPASLIRTGSAAKSERIRDDEE